MFLPLSSCRSLFFSPPHSPTYKKTTVMTKNHSKFSITLITLITFFKNLNHRKKRNHSNHRNTVILVMVLPALASAAFWSKLILTFDIFRVVFLTVIFDRFWPFNFDPFWPTVHILSCESLLTKGAWKNFEMQINPAFNKYSTFFSHRLYERKYQRYLGITKAVFGNGFWSLAVSHI